MNNSFHKRSVALRHWLIKSRWRTWVLPVVCFVPYVFSICWMVYRGLNWIAQIMLAPMVMGLILALLTLDLARKEFTRQRRR